MGNPAKTSFTLGEVAGGKFASSDKPARKQVGAVWEREAKSSGETFYKIRLDIDSQELQTALALGKTKLDLIAFKNGKKEAGDNKPNFRVYVARD